MDSQNPANRDDEKDGATEQTEMTQERRAFLSRLAGFGLGEATERLLAAGGVLPAGRGKTLPPSPLPNS
jgi:hypothetical protein